MLLFSDTLFLQEPIYEAIIILQCRKQTSRRQLFCVKTNLLISCRFQLVRIFEKQQEWERKGGLSSFDPKCTIFVCNKWDLVKKHTGKDETSVWDDIKNELKTKLKDQLPNISEDQIFKMSVTEVGGVWFKNITF